MTAFKLPIIFDQQTSAQYIWNLLHLAAPTVVLELPQAKDTLCQECSAA